MIARRFLFGATLCALLALAAPSGMAAPASGEPIRLPFPYIFSGPLIEFGERVWNEGLQLGVQKVNEEGGVKGRPLEFYKVDVRFPETAAWISEFRRLCQDPALPVIFGVGATKSVVAIYDEAKTCGIPIFAPSSGGQWPRQDFAGWIFRYQPMPETVMPILFRYVKERLGAKTAAMSFTLDDEFGVSNANVSRQVLKQVGIELLTEQSFRAKETNLASQIAAIRAANPDIIVMHHQPGDAGAFLLQLRERGVNAQVVTDVNVGGEDFWRLSKGKAKGALGYAIYAATDPRPVVQEWVARWRKATNRPDAAPDNFVTAYYDAVQILARVLNNSKDLSRESIKQAFLAIRDLDSISGKVSWLEVGDVVRSQPILVQLGDNGVLLPWP